MIFYEDSTAEERTKFLKFAVKWQKADKVITKEENKYLKNYFCLGFGSRRQLQLFNRIIHAPMFLSS